jgi:hypothetical protein
MALMLVSQLVEIACGIIFGFPERFFQAGLAFRGTGARAVYIVRYFSQFDRIIRVNLTQRVLQSVRRADEFLWHRQPTDSSSGLPCSAQL